jgi:hypothetical protein
LIHHVDPSGAHVLASRVDLFLAVRRDLPDSRELSVANADVGENPRIPFAVEDAAVSDHDVVRRVRQRA